MKEITRIEISTRTTKRRNLKVITKTYYTNFNDGLGERKAFVVEYTYNKYGFVIHKTLENINYKKISDFYCLDNISIINISIGYYTREVVMSADYFIE